MPMRKTNIYIYIYVDAWMEDTKIRKTNKTNFIRQSANTTYKAVHAGFTVDNARAWVADTARDPPLPPFPNATVAAEGTVRDCVKLGLVAPYVVLITAEGAQGPLALRSFALVAGVGHVLLLFRPSGLSVLSPFLPEALDHQ